MDTFTIKRGDTSPSLRRTLEDFAGAVNLVGASVNFKMVDSEFAVVVSRSAVVEDGAGGVVVFEWQAADTSTPGVFFGEFEVTYADNTRETFPNADYVKITVEKDL